MSRVLLCADTHLGDAGIIRFRKQFSSPEEHDAYIVHRWNHVVGKNDTVYLLGDAAFTLQAVETARELRGHKILIRGNHDKLNHFHYAWAFDDVRGGLKYKGAWLTHIPMHPDELRGCPNIHGHTHQHIIDNPWYLNVCMEQINYRPLPFTEAMDTLLSRIPL